MFYCEFHIYVWECFTVSYTQKYENIATNKKKQLKKSGLLKCIVFRVALFAAGYNCKHIVQSVVISLLRKTD